MNTYDELTSKQRSLTRLFRTAIILLVILLSFAVGWLVAMVSLT
jgi:hypothetical protein